MFTTNPDCIECADDPQGLHHYHCGVCNAGPVNAYVSGHKCDVRIPHGAVVEWYQQITAGVSNVPKVRRIGRVNHVRNDGHLVVFDPEGLRCIVKPADVTVLAEHAEAGWANL